MSGQVKNIDEETLKHLIEEGSYYEASKLSHLLAYKDYIEDEKHTHEIGYYLTKREQEVLKAISERSSKVLKDSLTHES